MEGACRISLACVAAYILFCAANRFLAWNILAKESKVLKPQFAYIFPEPLGPHRWRAVLRSGNLYREYLIHNLSGRMELKKEIKTDIGEVSVEEIRQSPAARKLEAFFKAPVWRVEEGGLSHGNTVTVYDLRFTPLVLERGKPFEFAFKTGELGLRR